MQKTQANRERLNPHLRFRMDREALEEFMASECGRWEDHGAPPDVPMSEPLAYNILGRFKTQIVLYEQAEVNEIWWALCSGTFQLHRPVAAKNLAERLRPFVKDEELLRQWPWPKFN